MKPLHLLLKAFFTLLHQEQCLSFCKFYLLFHFLLSPIWSKWRHWRGTEQIKDSDRTFFKTFYDFEPENGTLFLHHENCISRKCGLVLSFLSEMNHEILVIKKKTFLQIAIKCSKKWGNNVKKSQNGGKLFHDG